jgi:glucan-binding YG repeat protein
MQELININKAQLPTTVDELEKYIAIGKEQQKARQAQIRAYDKIEAAETTKKAVLENAQNEADTLLDAEIKLGELLDKRPRNKPFALKDSGSHQRTTVSDLPPSIDKKESHYLRAIANNQDVVEQVKAKARETNTLATEKDVLKEVKNISNKKKQKKREQDKAEQARKSSFQPTVEHCDYKDWLSEQDQCDLLLTDPPYSTDIEDIEKFASEWLPLALSKVKPTGRAYVFIGAYPNELAAYLAVKKPNQILVWTYQNTLGPTPKFDYKLNWQAILYYRMPDAPPLDSPIMLEQFSVQNISAPDGRQGDRYHQWQKPLEIAEQFIRHSTKEGDLILDPFCCTGSFLLAGAKLNRIARGCDISRENLEIAERRGCIIIGKKTP